MGHAHAVVPDGEPVEGLGGLGGRGGGAGGELAALGAGGVLAAFLGRLLDVLGLLGQPLCLRALVLEVVVELLVEALDVSDAAELVEALLGDFLAGEIEVGVRRFWKGERRRAREEERKRAREHKSKINLITHIKISMSGSSLIDSAASSEFSTSSRIDV